jgi:ABC-type uncharacterized transport system auxiliary subunit
MACFGVILEQRKHYYTLNAANLHGISIPHYSGLCRVRDLDTEAAYDRFQVVLRKSPYEISYRQSEVWAVKPGRIISDILARGILAYNVFSSVSRELSERRPDYLLSGELHTIEIIDERTRWTAHLSYSLQISSFNTGKTLWTFHTDTQKETTMGDYTQAMYVLSSLLGDSIDNAFSSLANSQAFFKEAQ